MPSQTRTAALIGIAGCLLFWISLFVFGELHSDYSQLTKGVSELGVFGAPHALLWNIIGFIAPGLSLAISGVAIARAVEPSRPRSAGAMLLMASGLGFAGTGVIPAEMHGGSPDMESPYTMGHVIMTFVSAVPWLLAMFLLVGPMKRNAEWRALGNVSLVMGVLAIASFGLRATTLLPGVAQRIAFALYFLWFLVMSVRLLSVGIPANRSAA